jgi:coenzyme F420-reducing hydrogenase delta subunit
MIMAGNNEAQCSNQKHLLSIESKLDSLLQLMDVTTCDNEELLMAYHASHEENAILKATVDDMIRQILDLTVTPTPPSPHTTADTSSTMDKMSVQLDGVHIDI